MGAVKRLVRRTVRKAAKRAAPHQVAHRLITGKPMPSKRVIKQRLKRRALAPFETKTVAAISKGRDGKLRDSGIKPLPSLSPLSRDHRKPSKTTKAQRAKQAESARIERVVVSTVRRDTQAARRASVRTKSANARQRDHAGMRNKPSASPMARNFEQDADGHMAGSSPDRVRALGNLVRWTKLTCEWCRGSEMRPLYGGNTYRVVRGLAACDHTRIPPTPPGFDRQLPPSPGDVYVCPACANDGTEIIRYTFNGRNYQRKVVCHICWGYIAAWNGATATKAPRRRARDGEQPKAPRVTLKQAQREYEKANRRANQLLGRPDGED